LVETAVVLTVFLTILLGSLDLGLVMLRQNVLAAAATRIARAASFRGQRAAAEGSDWGPRTVVETGVSNEEIAEIVRPVLVTIADEDARIRIEWPDGLNEPGSRLRVTVAYRHRWMLPFLFGSSARLTALSVGQVAH
jgi:Flp pilus assembly protein TadG